MMRAAGRRREHPQARPGRGRPRAQVRARALRRGPAAGAGQPGGARVKSRRRRAASSSPCARCCTALEKSSIREIDPPPARSSIRTATRRWPRSKSEAEPNTVVAVLQKGYLLHDRVLRPALVTVAKAVEKPSAKPHLPTADFEHQRGRPHGKDHRHRPRHHQLAASPSWKAASPRSSRTPKARAPRLRSSPTRTTARSWSARRPSARRSPTRRTPLYAVKRLIGRKFDENEVQKDIELMPYKIVQGRQRRRLGRGARQEDRAAGGLGARSCAR